MTFPKDSNGKDLEGTLSDVINAAITYLNANRPPVVNQEFVDGLKFDSEFDAIHAIGTIYNRFMGERVPQIVLDKLEAVLNAAQERQTQAIDADVLAPVGRA